MTRQIIYTPPEDSNYTGILSGICYVDGKQVSEEEFRKDVINHVLAIWQSNNCTRCVFADDEKVGTGEPCCTRVKGPERIGGICNARRERYL